jgi:hypothetical protein
LLARTSVIRVGLTDSVRDVLGRLYNAMMNE